MPEILSSLKKHINDNHQEESQISNGLEKYISITCGTSKVSELERDVLRELYILSSFQRILIQKLKNIQNSEHVEYFKDLIEQELVQLEIRLSLLAAQYEYSNFELKDSTKILLQVCIGNREEVLKIFTKLQNYFESLGTTDQKNICEHYVELSKNLKYNLQYNNVDVHKMLENYFPAS